MLRPKAVRELLVEAAGVRLPGGDGEAAAELSAEAAEAARQREREALDHARRRGLLAVVVDAVAIAALLALRESDRFLTLGRDEETIFTVGVLVVAVHLGWRLAQAATVGTVRRLHDEVSERES